MPGSVRDESTTYARAAQVARACYGRLLALVAARSGDLAAAEDALAEAFRQALAAWPESGIPANPEGWLLTVAHRRRIDAFRSAASPQRNVSLEDAGHLPSATTDPQAIPDERLKLLFVCAHPAIDRSMRAPLMLQTVLGLEAEAIGRAFLVPSAAMAQRLVRAKRKIKAARIPFVVPDRADMPARVEAVLEAIYGAFAIGWELTSDMVGDDDLGAEAMFLATLLAELLPSEPETLGLASLITCAQSRRIARFDANGCYVPLGAQDCRKWDMALIARAEAFLVRARMLGALGRFQLEAAIQSVHADRARTGVTDWASVALLYEGLMRIAPSIGAAVGRAAAVGRVQGAAAGLAALDLIEQPVRDNFQPAWALRSHLLHELGRAQEAVAAFDQAIRLTHDRRVRDYLIGERSLARRQGTDPPSAH